MDDEDEYMGSQYYNHLIDEFYEGPVYVEIYLDEIMFNDTHVRQFQDVDPSHLSKICRIYLDDAKRNLDVTTRTRVSSQEPNLIWNYVTNNRMIRYKSI